MVPSKVAYSFNLLKHILLFYSLPKELRCQPVPPVFVRLGYDDCVSLFKPRNIVWQGAELGTTLGLI